MSADSTVELPDLSSENKELTNEELKIKELEYNIKLKDETIDYLKKALDIALKHEPTFVYEHCGHCPIKPENN